MKFPRLTSALREGERSSDSQKRLPLVACNAAGLPVARPPRSQPLDEAMHYGELWWTVEASVDGQTVSRPIRPAATVQPTGYRSKDCKLQRSKDKTKERSVCALLGTRWELALFFFWPWTFFIRSTRGTPLLPGIVQACSFLHIRCPLSLTLSPRGEEARKAGRK